MLIPTIMGILAALSAVVSIVLTAYIQQQPAPDSSTEDVQKNVQVKKKVKKARTVGLLVTALAVITFLLTWLPSQGAPDPMEPPPTPAPTTTTWTPPTPEPSDSAESSSSPSDSSEPSDPAPSESTIEESGAPIPEGPDYLSDRTSVDNNYGYDRGLYTIRQTAYVHSILMCSVTRCDDPEAWIDYNIPEGATQLTGAVGVASSSDSDCKAQAVIEVDRKVRFAKTMATFDKIQTLKIDLTGAIRVRLQMRVVNKSDKCRIAYGDVAFLK